VELALAQALQHLKDSEAALAKARTTLIEVVGDDEQIRW
jgi:hypothetical protein